MNQLRSILLAATLLSGAGVVWAAEDADPGQAQPAEAGAAGCTQKHSKALCIARAGHIAGALKDAAPGEVKALMANKNGDALWYAGAAAGSGTRVFRQAKGFSTGAEVGVLLLGMLSSMTGNIDLVGRNVVVAWMPAQLAASKEEANERAEQMLLDATFASFNGSTISVESTSAAKVGDPYSLKKSDLIRYRVEGGICEGHECFLMPQMKSSPNGGVMGARAYATKGPDFVGGGDSYQYATRVGALYALALIVDGKLQTHTYLEELSKRLPDWMYTVSSPETKLAGGQWFNEGQKIPVIYNRGKAMYFSYPAVDSMETATLSAN